MIRCLCGGQLGSVIADTQGDQARAITYRCCDCHRHLVLQLNLRLLPALTTGACGTNAGYQRHVARHEPACTVCKQARADYMAQRRKAAS